MTLYINGRRQTEDAGGIVADYPAGETLSALTVVRANASGQVVHADSTDISHADVFFGITETAVTVVGANVKVRHFGAMKDTSWSWTLNAPIFFNASGKLTQTPPTTGFSAIVGVPITTDTILFNIVRSVQLA